MATLRARLVLASLAAFFLVLGLGVLNLRAAYLARSAVAQAQTSYQRVALYTRLDDAANAFESAAIGAVVRLPGADLSADPARGRFLDNLARVARARFGTPAEEAARRGILSQGRAVAVAFSDPTETARLDRIEKTSGARGVAAEISRKRAPYDTLRESLGREIESGDAEVAAANQHAIAVGRSASAAAVLGCAGLIVVALAIMLTLLRRLRLGLDRLEIGARALGSGVLSHRIGLDGGDELTALSNAFDAMAGKIQHQQAALQAANATLETAVAARTGELLAANETLAAEDRRRRAFLADVGHELRTPLTIIRGEAQLALRSADLQSTDPSAVYERILDQTRDLERLVDDLFLIARAEGGGLKLNLRRTELGELVRRVASDFEVLAVDGRAVIHAAAAAGVEADVDPDRVRQMMAALIDNALRHTHPGVTIEVLAEMGPAGPCIAICDDGPGVPTELAETLFSRFRRGDGGGQGSGLGLAVVRALAEAHGGAAGLENRPGGGARAWLSFPAPALVAA